MTKLPFVVSPRLKPVTEQIGSEDSGKIEIERYGYLTAGERSFMQSNSTEEKTLSEVLSLTRKIGKAYSMDMKEAYELVMVAMTDQSDEDAGKIWEDFGEELGALTGGLMRQEQTKKILKALCLCIYRIDAEITVDDIIKLHDDIVDGLAELFDDEEAKSTKRLLEVLGVDEDAAVEESIDEAEKK